MSEKEEKKYKNCSLKYYNLDKNLIEKCECKICGKKY